MIAGISYNGVLTFPKLPELWKSSGQLLIQKFIFKQLLKILWMQKEAIMKTAISKHVACYYLSLLFYGIVLQKPRCIHSSKIKY